MCFPQKLSQARSIKQFGDLGNPSCHFRVHFKQYKVAWTIYIFSTHPPYVQQTFRKINPCMK